MNKELELHTDVLRVINRVSEVRGVTVEQVLSKTRKKEVVTARFLSIYISRRSFDYGSKDLAKMFGYVNSKGIPDHSTVLWACKQVDRWMDVYSKIRNLVYQLEEEFLYVSDSLPARFQKNLA